MFYAYTARCAVEARHAAQQYRVAARTAYDQSWWRHMEGSKHARYRDLQGRLSSGRIITPETYA